jgi:hypothetical protein
MPVTDDGVVIDPGHSWSVRLGRRENVGDVTRGFERANEGAASEAGLGRGGDGQCRLWGSGRDGDVAGGRPVSETPGLRPRANRRCSETPLSEASDEAGR